MTFIFIESLFGVSCRIFKDLFVVIAFYYHYVHVFIELLPFNEFIENYMRYTYNAHVQKLV